MPKIPQQKAPKGSQKWLQFLVNRDRKIIDESIRKHLKLNTEDTIDWLSPLEDDCLAEYQDDEFLDRLFTQLDKRPLNSFWPQGGPAWDGLAKTSRGDILLVEAKAHVSELRSSCRASSPPLELIRDSLAETAEFYGSSLASNWTENYYQYANRLAHLYLLRQLNDIPAWLVFVYFVNDLEMDGPKSVDEWHKAIETIHEHLGVTTARLKPYVIEVFTDVAELATNATRVKVI